MFIDLHEHTGGISWCCQMNAEQIVEEAQKAGFDGFVLTNHYCTDYTRQNGFDAWIEEYIKEFYRTERIAREKGLRVFFGVEVTAEFDRRVHILLYGADETFLRTHKELYYLSAEELYDHCHKNGIFVVQAHPYRNGTEPLPLSCVDGYEVNCHPKYGSTCSEELLAINEKTGVLLTCGCDYHGDVEYRPQGGVLLPDHITDSKQLAEYLFTTKEMTLRIHELYATETYDKTITVK